MRSPTANVNAVALIVFAAVALVACVQDDPITKPARTPSKEARSIRIPPGSLNDLIAITAGSGFTCALRRNQHVYCWGLNDVTQAGVATGSAICSPNWPRWCVPTPQILMDTSTKNPLLAIQIDAGFWHACALRPDGTAVCWGYNDVGQIGLNSPLVQASFPSPVFGGLQFSSIGAGGESTCGTTYLNGVMCWGDFNSALAPKAIPATVAGSPNYFSVTVGTDHFCVMDYTNNVYGSVSCAGKNQLGQVANNISSYWSPFSPSWFGNSVNRVTAEGDFTCVDQSSGVVQCAGDNTWGELGMMNYGVSTSTPKPQTSGWNVPQRIWTTLQGVTAGKNHVCALDQNSHAWCWGDNDMGQIGYGYTGGFAASPWPVAGNITFRALAAGYQHTCGIGTNNVVYCWGNNASGELGTGDTSGGSSNTPIPTVPF